MHHMYLYIYIYIYIASPDRVTDNDRALALMAYVLQVPKPHGVLGQSVI
jgi:hypothetical protein